MSNAESRDAMARFSALAKKIAAVTKRELDEKRAQARKAKTKPGSTDLARSGVFADARTGAHLN